MKISLYIHIPFCVRKCLYCDFLSGPFDDKVRTRYIETLIKEIESSAFEYKDYEVVSIFFGGGTPSILAGNDILRIMNSIRENYRLSRSAEITIECNPGTVDEEKLYLYKKAGINRLSIGLQSSIDEELKRLGRIHTLADFEKIYNQALSTGFENINVDLMSGLPGQSVDDYIRTLEYVTGLAASPETPGFTAVSDHGLMPGLAALPNHISAYSLIVEEGTPFYDKYRNGDGLPSEEEERKMYEITDAILTKHGYHRYEISNYAKEGYECIHNSVYWRRGNYLGLGLGSSSMVDNVRWKNTSDMRKYLSGEIKEDITKLTKEDQMEEFMFLGLRMMEGISVSSFKEYFEEDMPEQYYEVIKKYKNMGLMEFNDDRVMLTKEGINLSNTIFSEFLL